MAAIDVVNRLLREFRRYTGDGLPNEPVNAPLPIGDPQSGPHSPDKAALRSALLAPLNDVEVLVQSAEEYAERAEQAAEEAGNQLAGVVPSRTRYAVGGPVQSINLGNPQLVPNAIAVYINGVYQFGNAWALNAGILTPVGGEWPGDGIVQNMEVSVDGTSALTFGTPSNGSVTRDKIVDGAVGQDQIDPDIMAMIEAPETEELADRVDVLEASDSYLRIALRDAKQVPSGFLSGRFLQLPGYKIRLIAQEIGVYNAFPGGLRRFGDDVIAIYSSGSGHGVTDRQRSLRSNDGFLTFEEGVFLLNSTGVNDNSFLDGLLPPGQAHNFKSVFTVKNVAGELLNFTTSVVTVTDPYALWGSPVFINDRWYTTGYRTSGGQRRPALFESTNGMESWTFVTLIASVGSKELSETSIVHCANGDWLAIIRNDTDPNDRALDISRSTNGGVTWSVPTTLAGMKGTQPHLLKLSNGDILLFCGDRTGSSGLDAVGNPVDADDITGIAFWKSTNHGVTWSAVKMLAPSWSTDCGQPIAIELADGTVGVMCYLSPGATNGNRGVEPGIYWIEFDPRQL